MAEQKKLSGVAIGLMAFGPFVLYGFASGANHWGVATGGGLILCLVFIAVRRSRGVPTRLMDWTTMAFFVIGSVLMIGLRSAAFPAYNVVVIWSCFAVAAWSSIAIGHPFGMTGSRLVGTIANEMIRRRARYGVVTMCIGGGQGAAGLFELCL